MGGVEPLWGYKPLNSAECDKWGQMVKCGRAGMRACSLKLVGFGFRVRDKVRVSVRDRVGVRVSDGFRVSTSYFLSHQQPTESRISAFYP